MKAPGVYEFWDLLVELARVMPRMSVACLEQVPVRRGAELPPEDVPDVTFLRNWHLSAQLANMGHMKPLSTRLCLLLLAGSACAKSQLFAV